MGSEYCLGKEKVNITYSDSCKKPVISSETDVPSYLQSTRFPTGQWSQTEVWRIREIKEKEDESAVSMANRFLIRHRESG